MIAGARDVAVHVGHPRVLRERAQHLRNRAGEVRIGQRDPLHDRLRRRDVGRVRRLGEQVAEGQVFRVELIGKEAAAAAAEEVAHAAGVCRRRGEFRRQRELNAGVPVLVARRTPANLRVAVGDAAAAAAPDDETGIERRIEERRRGIRRHAVVPVVRRVEPVRARERGIGGKPERPGTVARARPAAHSATPRVIDAVGGAEHEAIVHAVCRTDARTNGAVIGLDRSPAVTAVLARAGKLDRAPISADGGIGKVRVPPAAGHGDVVRAGRQRRRLRLDVPRKNRLWREPARQRRQRRSPAATVSTPTATGRRSGATTRRARPRRSSQRHLPWPGAGVRARVHALDAMFAGSSRSSCSTTTPTGRWRCTRRAGRSRPTRRHPGLGARGLGRRPPGDRGLRPGLLGRALHDQRRRHRHAYNATARSPTRSSSRRQRPDGGGFVFQDSERSSRRSSSEPAVRARRARSANNPGRPKSALGNEAEPFYLADDAPTRRLRRPDFTFEGVLRRPAARRGQREPRPRPGEAHWRVNGGAEQIAPTTE